MIKIKRKTLLIASLGTIFLMTLSAIAIYYNELDKRYYELILKTSVLIQLLCIMMYLFSRPKLNKKYLKIIRHRFDNKFTKGNVSIFPEPISSTNPRNPAIFKIYFEAGEFTKENPPEMLVETNRTDIKSNILNIKTRVENDVFFCNLDIKVMPNEKINFKFNKDVNIKIFNLEEVYLLG